MYKISSQEDELTRIIPSQTNTTGIIHKSCLGLRSEILDKIQMYVGTKKVVTDIFVIVVWRTRRCNNTSILKITDNIWHVFEVISSLIKLFIQHYQWKYSLLIPSVDQRIWAFHCKKQVHWKRIDRQYSAVLRLEAYNFCSSAIFSSNETKMHSSLIA